LRVDRLNVQIDDTRVAQAASAFAPTFNSTIQRNSQLSPPSSFLVGSQGTLTNAFNSNVGVGQRLPWGGGSYNIGWNTSHTESNSFLQNFNPLLTSGLQISLSQPLLRDLWIDNSRQQLEISRRNREIGDTRLQESTVQTLAEVKRAYWDLVSSRASVDVQQRSLDLAKELARVNKARVDVGQMPPLDLVSAQAEVAQREEQLIIAQTNARQAEDRVRTLIIAPDRPDLWNTRIETTDAPPAAMPAPDIDAAVNRALRERSDLVRARMEIDNAATSVKFYDNQKLPDLRVQANYLANGLGGTRLQLRGGELRARQARGESGARAVEERRSACDPPGASGRMASGNEFQTHPVGARRARAGRAAPRRRAKAVRGRDVDELPGHPGAARSCASADERAPGDAGV
jgi:outer membrane protein TolC